VVQNIREESKMTDTKSSFSKLKTRSRFFVGSDVPLFAPEVPAIF
jgi:hypothetical protein